MSEQDNTEISYIKREVNILNSKVDRLLELIRGNDLDVNDLGILGIVNSNKNKIEKLEKLKDKFVWILIGMSMPTSFGILQVIGWLYDKMR